MDHQNSRRVRASVMLLVGAWTVAWTGCRESDPVGDDRNLPPQTYLVEAPDYGESGFYINHLFWDGFDPDGRVSHFEVTVTDSFGNLEDAVWRLTFKSDSLVRFPVGGDNGQAQVLGNRFYVRAVDLVGRPDPDPAWIFFSANDPGFPLIEFNTAEGFNPNFPNSENPTIFQLDEFLDDRGNPICDAGFPADTIPAGSQVTFTWTGVDNDSLFGTGVGSVTAFEYKLTTVDNTFIGGTLADTSATYTDLEPGPHTFFVRTFDDGGLAGQGCRYFQVNFDPRCALRPVMNSCTGEPELAFRLSTRQFSNEDPCAEDFTFTPWDPVTQGMPELSPNPCLPPGYFAVSDTLPAAPQGQLWWFEVEGSCSDPDGELTDLEMNYLDCRRSRNGELTCRASRWECASRVEAADTTFVIGPIRPGDTKFVIAGVDDLEQRGAANADTIGFIVDLAPRLAHIDTLLYNDTCNRFAAAEGDTITVCNSESTLVVTSVQEGAVTTPCAYETEFLSGAPAGVSARDYGSLPLPDRNYDLEFVLEPENPNDPNDVDLWVAQMPVQLWLYDVDGTRRVDYVRWNVDGPPRPDVPFERVTDLTTVANEGELTPTCFEARVVNLAPGLQNEPHFLYVEIMDHKRGFNDLIPAAERRSIQIINFTVNDIAGARYTLTGSKP